MNFTGRKNNSNNLKEDIVSALQSVKGRMVIPEQSDAHLSWTRKIFLK